MNTKTIQLSNGLKLQYAEHGNTGTPVIFLHGFTDSLRSYQLIFPYLPETIHAYALSQRGHGDSDRPPTNYTPRDFAADVAEFIDKLELESAIVVGHSMGATVAQRVAIDYPQKVIAVVLIGSFASFSDNASVLELHDAVSAFVDRVDKEFIEEFQKSTITKPVSNTFFETIVGESMKLPVRVWKLALGALMNVDNTKELTAVDKPVLLVWGDHDSFAVRKDQNRLLQALSNARLSIYEGVGHCVQWEEPKRFVQELKEFVKEVVEKQVEVV